MTPIQNPETRQLGRNAAISQLEDGIIIVDTTQQIIYINPAAADLLGCDPAEVLGQPVWSLLNESALDFDIEDSLAGLEYDGRDYEVRTSPVCSQHDRLIGHTIIIHDVTIRTRREHQLAYHQSEIKRLNELNAVIRGVNQALIPATTREEVERAVCERLADSDLYETVCAADIPTWSDDADRWITAGTDTAEPTLPDALHGDEFEVDVLSTKVVSAAAAQDDWETWIVVPLIYGRMVYGALGQCTQRESIPDEERNVLAELGELIGYAINAIEHRRLIAAEAVVELEFVSTDDDEAFVAAAQRADCRLELSGLVPDAGGTYLAYVNIEGTSPDHACDSITATTSTSVRTIHDSENGGLIEWTVSGNTLLGMLVNHGTNVLQAHAEDGAANVVVEVASDADVRMLRDRVRQAFPETRLDSKREYDRPIDRSDRILSDAVEDLTDRQREALKTAFRAGYFDWPRESTAEEVASALDIAPPTLHAHLRKAEKTLLAGLFDLDRSDRD